MLAVGPLHARLRARGGEPRARHRERALRAAGAHAQGARQRAAPAEGMLRDLSEVKIGDPVVHEQHGIGRYRGLVTMDLGEGEAEFLTLEYAGSDKLYVPVSSLHLIARYSGAPAEAAPLHQLGSGQWEKARAQGGGAGARHRRGAPQPLRAARAARGPRVQGAPARLRGLPRGLSRSRRRPTRPPPSTPCSRI